MLGELGAALGEAARQRFVSWDDELWQGACAAHDPRLSLTVESRRDTGGDVWRWRIG